ncbi:MAG: hypothetical protein Q8P18_23275 [Pseudomonadota bacterium]|nr:hypothetical protein [Pseudomonadota bacterium]
MLALLLACASGGDTDGDSAAPDPACTPSGTGYAIPSWTDPAPIEAGVEVEYWFTVEDDAGCPIEDLQQAHERMVHTLFISRDLSSFQHEHHEDHHALTADVLRSATYHFPVTFPLAGDYLALYDFAHQNQYLNLTNWLTVGGEPAQMAAPVPDLSTVRDVEGMQIELRWDVAPFAGYEASFTVIVTESGADVTDFAQYLGADGHAAFVTHDLAFSTHTHAWFPGMEDMGPGMEMPHLYLGPELPFHYTFPTPGPHRMWVQFSRQADPERPFTVPFDFEVAP